MWCENLYTCCVNGCQSVIDYDEDDFPDFSNFQWVAWFLANEMTRVVDYGYIFETTLKNVSNALEIDYNPSLDRQRSIGIILKKATIKAIFKAIEVAVKYNIPFDIDYYERKHLINKILYKRVKV